MSVDPPRNEAFHQQHKINKEVPNLAISDVINKRYGLRFDAIIGKGKFGYTIRTTLLKVKKHIVVKVVKTENVGANELRWSELKHKNILRLYETIYCAKLDAELFFTPAELCSLKDVLLDSSFMKLGNYIKKMTQWIKSVTSALDYLHSKNLGHLNVIESSVLISSDVHAKLSEFHFLCKTGVPTTNYEVPDHYKPPEACGADTAVEARSFDVWCLGMLTMKMWSECATRRNKPRPKTPAPLKERARARRGKGLESMRDFASSCLRAFPGDRPVARGLLEHNFLDTKESKRRERTSCYKRGKSRLLRRPPSNNTQESARSMSEDLIARHVFAVARAIKGVSENQSPRGETFQQFPNRNTFPSIVTDKSMGHEEMFLTKPTFLKKCPAVDLCDENSFTSQYFAI